MVDTQAYLCWVEYCIIDFAGGMDLYSLKLAVVAHKVYYNVLENCGR